MSNPTQSLIDRICKSLGVRPQYPDETPSRAATHPVPGERNHDSLRLKVAAWSGLRTILDDDPVLNAPQAPAVGHSKQASDEDNGHVLTERLATTGFTANSAQQMIVDTIAPHLAKHSKQSTQGLGTQHFTSTHKQAAWPGVQQAHQAMQRFMPNQGQRPAASPPPPVPGAAAGSQVAAGGGVPQSGLSPMAPGAPTMLGIHQRPIGLDAPSDTRATPLPGTPGHAATNVIDQRGGLDPRGLTVDGNNAAGIKKFAGLADRLMAYETNHIDRLIRPGSEAYESFYVDRLIRSGVKRASLRRAVNRNQLQKQAGYHDTNPNYPAGVTRVDDGYELVSDTPKGYGELMAAVDDENEKMHGNRMHNMSHTYNQHVSPWYSPYKINSNVVEPVANLLNYFVGPAGFVAGAYSRNPLLGAGIGAGAGLLTTLPSMYTNYQDRKTLRDKILPFMEDPEAAQVATDKAPTSGIGDAAYGAVSAAMGGIGGLVGGLKGRAREAGRPVPQLKPERSVEDYNNELQRMLEEKRQLLTPADSPIKLRQGQPTPYSQSETAKQFLLQLGRESR